MKLSFLRLGWRTLLRDLRAGELRLLMVAVTPLAVAALASVGARPARRAAARRPATAGRRCCGGQRQPHAQAFVDKAQALGLQTVGTMGFPTMGRAGDSQGGASKLVALRRALRRATRCAARSRWPMPGAAEQATRDIPPLGEVWVDAPLLDALGLAMGNQLLLGDAQLRIARIDRH